MAPWAPRGPWWALSMVRMVKLLPVAAEQLHSSLCPHWREPTCPGAHPTRLRTFRVSHIQDLWRFCTCKTSGYLCTQGISAPKAFGISLHLESLLPMQNLRGVSAPRISGVYPNTKLLGCHCTSGAFLHPRALGASATEISWGVSHPAALKHFTPRTGVSLLPEPLEHPAPKTFGVSHALGSGALCPPGSAHRRGPRAPQPRRPRPICPPGLPSTPPMVLPQGARGAGREANSCGSARSGSRGLRLRPM